MVAHNPPRDNRCFRLRAACRASGRQLEDVTCAVGSLGIDRPTCHEALTLLYERLLRNDSDGDRIRVQPTGGGMDERTHKRRIAKLAALPVLAVCGFLRRRHSRGSESAQTTETDTDTSTVTTTTDPPPPDFDGCTPGYWKSTQHHDEWTGYTPGQTLESVFDVPDCVWDRLEDAGSGARASWIRSTERLRAGWCVSAAASRDSRNPQCESPGCRLPVQCG